MVSIVAGAVMYSNSVWEAFAVESSKTSLRQPIVSVFYVPADWS